MSINNSPIFIAAPRIGSAITGAASSRDGDVGTYYPIFTPGPNGSRIERVTAITAGTMSGQSSAMAIRLYIQNVDDLDYYLYREGLLAQVTPGTGTIGANLTFNFNGGLCLGTQSILVAGQSTYADADDRVSFVVEAGDF